jgi:hypothetical protein
MFLRASSLLKGLLFLFTILMGLIITLSSYKHFFPYRAPSRFLNSKEPYYSIYLPALYGHITTSGLTLVLGFLCFFKYIRQRWLGVHQLSGKLYVFLVLFVSAPCGLIMGWYATGEWPVQTCFLLLSFLWWWFTWQAWVAIHARNKKRHGAFMLRSYSLAVSAICLRWYSFLGAYLWELRGPDVYTWLAWASWVPNLILVELYLNWRKRDLEVLDDLS